MLMVYLLLAFAVGLLLPLQAAVNNALRQQLGSGALLAALISFAVGTATLLGVSLATGQPLQALQGLGRVPPWQWLGGVLGAFFVFGSTLVAPRIGLAAMVALILVGAALVNGGDRLFGRP